MATPSKDFDEKLKSFFKEEYPGPVSVQFEIVEVSSSIWSGSGEVKVRAGIVHQDSGDTILEVAEEWLRPDDSLAVVFDNVDADQLIELSSPTT